MKAWQAGGCASIAAALLAGCGSAASEQSVSETVERFQAALTARDGAAACRELADTTTDELESQEQAPCPEAILKLGLEGGGAVTASRAYMTSGYATLDGDRGSVFLDQTPRGWRISAAGCSETKPERPFDCEVED